MKKERFVHSLMVLSLISLFSISMVSSQETGSISGKVIPAEAGIKVQTIQNLSLVAETFTDENGNYIIEGLAPGYYGLLFIKEGIVYIYNDEVNLLWREDGVKEFILVDPGTKIEIEDMNFNLDWEDYIEGEILLRFNPELTAEEEKEILDSYNLKIIKISSRYTVEPTQNKTVLEMISLLEKDSSFASVFANQRTFASNNNNSDNGESNDEGDINETQEEKIDNDIKKNPNSLLKLAFVVFITLIAIFLVIKKRTKKFAK